jgi:hypothetical protein
VAWKMNTIISMQAKLEAARQQYLMDLGSMSLSEAKRRLVAATQAALSAWDPSKE